MKIYERFYTLEELDLQNLIDLSIDKMDIGTVKWPSDRNTKTKKRNHIIKTINSIMNIPTFIGCKGTVDGENVIAIFGQVVETAFIGMMCICKPDVNGSRSYIYSRELNESFCNFLLDNGLERCISFIPKDSPIKKSVHTNFGVPNTPYVSFTNDYEILVFNPKDHIKENNI